MPSDDNKIVNSVLLPAAKIDTLMTKEEFWQEIESGGEWANVQGIFGEVVTFNKSELIGFIDRSKFKVPDDMRSALEAQARAAGLAPRGGSGIVVPGAKPY